jgi:hypothetical protein
MRTHKASRALIVSAATLSILGTTGMATNAAVAADAGPTAKKRTCSVKAYTDRVDRKTHKFGSGAIRCNYKPAYTKLHVTLYKGKKKMATATCKNHKRSCFVSTKAVKDDPPVQKWRTKVTGAWGSGKKKTVWSNVLHG